MHNLYKTYNIIVQGAVRNNESGIVHGQYEILADFPIQTNLILKENENPFVGIGERFLDRLNLEALENSVLLRIAATHITVNLANNVEEMQRVLSERIKLPNSPN